MTSALPQHSEAAFRRYERYIAEIIANHPKATLVRPEGIKAYTALARLRDAIRSMKVNGWTSTAFTYDEAANVFHSLENVGDFILTLKDEHTIYAGPKFAHHDATVTVDDSKPNLGVLPGEIDARESEVFSAILVLKQHGLLKEPVQLRHVSDAQKRILTSDPYLEFFPDDTDSALHILV